MEQLQTPGSVVNVTCLDVLCIELQPGSRSVHDNNTHTMNNPCITESLQERGVEAWATVCVCTCVHHKSPDVSRVTISMHIWRVLDSAWA